MSLRYKDISGRSVAAAVILALSLFACKKEQPAVQVQVLEEKSAIATFVMGDVKVTRPGEAPGALAAMDRIKAGSVIETGDNASATIQINDVGSINISRNSRLIIDSILSAEKGTMLDLARGRVFSRILKKPGIKYGVKTSTMLAAVRGTEFLTVADQGTWQVLVRTGVVSVSTSSEPEGRPVAERKKAEVNKKGRITISFQNRIQELTLEGFSVKSPYIENLETKTADDVRSLFRDLESEQKKIEQKIEKAKEEMLSPLDRLRKQGKPLVELYLKDGSQIIGSIEKTEDGKLFLNTGESIITIPKEDIKRRIPVK